VLSALVRWSPPSREAWLQPPAQGIALPCAIASEPAR